MFRSVILLCLLAALDCAYAGDATAKTKFLTFEDMPKSVSDATSAGWAQVTGPTRIAEFESLTTYCKKADHSLCMLFDEDGWIAGMQVAIRKDLFTPYFNMTVQGFTDWTASYASDPSVTYDFYAKTMFFIEMDADARTAWDSTSDSILRASKILLEGINGELMEVATDLSDLDSMFTLQRCFVLMGTHYYYNMTSSLECEADQFLNWFTLADSSKTTGIGFMCIGSFTTTQFETPGALAVQFIVKDGPQWLYDAAANVGVLTMHFYFENPLTQLCL